MKKNRSTSKSNTKFNRQSLINKISDAMSIKYSNFFTAAKYDTKTLKEDVGRLLSTQYYSKDPRDVFKPIESNILEIVKAKNPQLQVKVKKARKLPEIKYTKDKYQEADDLDKEKEEKNIPKAVARQKSKALTQKNNLNKKTNTIKENKDTNKDNNNKIQLTDINNKDNNNNINNDNQNEKKEENNTTYKILEEYGFKHTLLDQLNNRKKYDPAIKLIDEENKLYEKEQKEKKQKKLLEQQNYLNDLKIQIEETNKRKQQERQKELKEFEELQEQIKLEREQLKKEKLDEIQRKEKLRQNYDKLLQEKDTLKKQKKLEEEKESKLYAELINEEIINEKKNNIERKNKIKEEILKTQEINERLYKEKINSQKQNEVIEEQEIFHQQNSLSNNAIKERINKRALEQEAAGKYLLKIINSLEKQNRDIYSPEKEMQEQKKKMEYEIADKNRQNKIEDYKKSLLDILAKKNLEKEKQREEEANYRKSLEEEYALYLKEEKEKKLKQIEKYENYRKALEEQIKDNKMRDIERMKYK